MKYKTISGHYDTVFSLAHNNRLFIPQNVDPTRVKNDFIPVRAGEEIGSDYPEIKALSELWDDYRQLSDAYWQSYRDRQEELSRKLWDEIQKRMEFQSTLQDIFDFQGDPGAGIIIGLLLFPLLFAGVMTDAVFGAIDNVNHHNEQCALRAEGNLFRLGQQGIRDVLREQDRIAGTKMLLDLDDLVRQAEVLFEMQLSEPAKFATLDEVYNKVFEPGFQKFQQKQRKCRRYNGTYLEQIREKQSLTLKTKNKNEKIRTSAEAIEIVFGIGDRDNTGYVAALDDAMKAESLLRDFTLHLLAQPNVCTITTRELNNPEWKPPFKHGLILLNLVCHFDEDTPGIHATFIPYSRGCRRGPDAQPAMGRAFTGMGYPSTWKDVLDDNHNPISKTDRSGNILLNKDGSIRTKKEPDKQGILDWIEEQKAWIQTEMHKRYGWERKYKGSHPRGNLSIPDYKVARAQERLAETEHQMRILLQNYYNRCADISNGLQKSIDYTMDNDPDIQLILKYMRTCTDAQYNALIQEVITGMEQFSAHEYAVAKKTLQELVNLADAQRISDSLPNKTNLHER